MKLFRSGYSSISLKRTSMSSNLSGLDLRAPKIIYSSTVNAFDGFLEVITFFKAISRRE